jgi:hypothetical protein
MAARVPVLLVCGLLISMAGAGAVVATEERPSSANEGTASTHVAEVSEVQTPDNESNDSMPHHQNPEEVGSDGNLALVKGWLNGRLAGLLRDSTLQISQAEYEQGRAVIGDGYDDYLSQFVDVAGETDSSADDETTETYRETKDTQQSFAETADEFEETYEAYQEARRNGNDERARELARKLNTLAEELRGYNRQLQSQYTELENQTGADFTESTQRLDNVTSNLTSQATAVTAAELVETELRLTANSTTVSFTQPLELTGQLRVTGNATPPEQARIRFSGRTQTVDLDANGSFTLTYQPRSTRVGERSLTATYVPADESLYLGSNASVDVSVKAVTPTVRVSEHTNQAGFGDEIRVAGDVIVNGTPVGNTPVELAVDGQRLRTTRTAADGSFVATASLPASIPAERVNVTVFAGQEGRAIARNSSTAPLDVQETTTTLDANGTATDESITVSGTLAASTGERVPSQRIEISVGDDYETTVRTSADGTFSKTIDTAAVAADPGDTVTVRAAFDGEATNLVESTAETQVELPSGNETGGGAGNGADGAGQNGGPLESSTDDLPFIVGGGLVLLLALFSLVGYRWRQRNSAQGGSGQPSDGTAEALEEETKTPTVASRLESLSADDPASLGRLTYLTLRAAVASATAVPDAATHWEFYQTLTERRPEFADDLRRVVETYELTVFADEPIDETWVAQARAAAIEIAESFPEDSTMSPDD